ncbi:hypothetical protein DFS33DRAFT_1289497 [Desarmillaria ectypa]|nr:hypothetical protein DFS33DRAFT_1289497 [Desarmillaria ectypa]
MDRIFMVVTSLLFTYHAFGAPIYPEDSEGLSTSPEDRRTLWNIVWSCLATIFACTWLAVHPNVPGRNITTKGAIPGVVERAKIMAIAILAPEAIVSWAAEQFIVAWELRHGIDISIRSVIHMWREKNDESKPTLAHGFFLSMGGFYYKGKKEAVDGATNAHDTISFARRDSLLSSVHEDMSEDTSPLNVRSSPDSIHDTVETVDVPGELVYINTLKRQPNLVKNLAEISAETIEDKSKGDALSKTISIVQIAWFIAQCVARAIQNLPITLLELCTLAFAGLSIITYCLWWYKPLNVKYHISLDGSDLNDFRPMSETNDFETSTSPVNFDSVINGLAWFLAEVTVPIVLETGHEHRDIGDGTYRLSSGIRDEWETRFAIMIGVGSLFGAFHCVAWSFDFPSHTEMVLWRFSSLTVLIGLFVGGHLPCASVMWKLGVFKYIPKLLWLLPCSPNWEPFFAVSSGTLVIVGGIAYIVARIILIILAFMKLRSLSPLAFHTVQWTTYIPYI